MKNRKEKSKALVIGSGGFIGKHLSNYLSMLEFEVIKASRYSFYQYYDGNYLRDLIKKQQPDYIFNLSAYGNMYHQRDLEETIRANITNVTSLLGWLKDENFKSFVHTSTSAVMLETQNIYSITKQVSENICGIFKRSYQMPIGIIRPMSVYGPNEWEGRFIPTVFRSCLTGEPMDLEPDAIHDWIYIDDFVKDMVEFATLIDDSPTMQVRVSGTGTMTTNKDVVAIIEKITGKKANIQNEKQMRHLDWTGITSQILAGDKSHSLEWGLRKVYNSIS